MTGVLAELARKHGSDKWGDHSYTPLYEKYFAEFREKAVNLLEIGVGGYEDPKEGGASLRMWRDYFPSAKIVGLDCFDKRSHAEARIAIYQGDQSDKAVLDRLNAEAGPFDIVIDDGSHQAAHVLASFRHLFPLLRSGGLYVIEDMQTAYWTVYGGQRPDAVSPATSVGLVKSLVDHINHREIPGGRAFGQLGALIAGFHVYHNIVFIERGDNNEESNILVDYELPAPFKHYMSAP